MKIKLLKRIALLAVACAFTFCISNSSDNNDELTDISNATGTWVCKPESNVTITLTFDSGKAYVKTFPQDINSAVTKGHVFFNDGNQYIVSTS